MMFWVNAQLLEALLELIQFARKSVRDKQFIIPYPEKPMRHHFSFEWAKLGATVFLTEERTHRIRDLAIGLGRFRVGKKKTSNVSRSLHLMLLNYRRNGRGGAGRSRVEQSSS